MIKTENFIKEKFTYIIAGISVFAAILYIFLAFNAQIWYDEAYSMVIIRHSFLKVCKITSLDVHPPLYYLLIKVFEDFFKDNEILARVLSIVPCMLVIVFGATNLKKLFNEKVAILFSLLYVIYPFLLKYSVEIRMYSWAEFFVFFSGISAYRCYVYNNKKDWLMYVLFVVCSAYTHYFAFVAAISVCTILFFASVINKKELLKRWFICSVLMFILYIPWLKLFLIQLLDMRASEYWIGPITLDTIFDYIKTYFGTPAIKGYWIITLLLCTYLLIKLIKTARKNIIYLSICAVLVSIMTIGVGILASVIVRPVFIIRYSIPAVPFFVLFLAFAMQYVKKKYMIIILAINIFAYGATYCHLVITKNGHFYPNIDAVDMVANRENCDAYVCLLDRNTRTQVPGILSYMEPQKTIYKTGYIVEPFSNTKSIDEFSTNDNAFVILLSDNTIEIPAKVLEHYSIMDKQRVKIDNFVLDEYKLKIK